MFRYQLEQLVVENVLTFNEGFWIRLAARTDTCKSEDDKAWFFPGLIFSFYFKFSILELILKFTFNNQIILSKDVFIFYFIFTLQKDYEELAMSIMSIVDRLVHKTNVTSPPI